MKKNLIYLSAAIAAMGMTMTGCIDNEEGDGLEALRKGIGEYYTGKAAVENANAKLTEATTAAKVAQEEAKAKQQEISNAYNEASNNIKLIVEQSNAEVTQAKNIRTIENEKAGVKTDTAGTYYKILAAIQTQQATQIGKEEALLKLQTLYATEIESYKVLAEQQAQQIKEDRNDLALRIIGAEIDYNSELAALNITKTQAELQAKLDSAEAVATNEKTKQQSLNTILATQTEVQALLSAYNAAKLDYEKAVADVEASAKYTADAKEYELQKIKAEYDAQIAELEKEARVAVAEALKTIAAANAEATAAEKAAETAVAGSEAEAAANAATDEAIEALVATLGTYIEAVANAQGEVLDAAKKVDGLQAEIVAKQLDIVKASIKLQSAITADSASLVAEVFAKETELKQAQDALTDAQKTLAEAEETLTKAQAKYDATVTPYETAKAELKVLKEANDAAYDAYKAANSTYEIAYNNLTDANTALSYATGNYNQFYEDSLTAVSKLASAKTELDNANTALADAKAAYNDHKDDDVSSREYYARDLSDKTSAQAQAAAKYEQAKTTLAYYTVALSKKYLAEIKTQKALVEKYTNEKNQAEVKQVETNKAYNVAYDKYSHYNDEQYATAEGNYNDAKDALTSAENAVKSAKTAVATKEGAVATAEAALANAKSDLSSFLANNRYTENSDTEKAQRDLIDAQNELTKKLVELDAAQKELEYATELLEEAEHNYEVVKGIVDEATKA